MALTINIEGKGVIANSDALINDTGGTGTGDWGEDGGGSISLSTETYLYGSSCVAGAYSNKSGYHYFDIGVGNELDFDVAGSEEGQHIYLWIFMPTPGLNETIANGGLTIRLGTSLSDYRNYMILASDDFNSWYGRWKCFVLDPTKPGSVTDTGTYDAGSIRYIGCYMDATALAKGDNLLIDQIAVGKGLRVTGTSTTGWKDIVDYCTDYSNRAWGMVQERDGIYYVHGKIYIGDTTQGAATSFSDSGRIIRFATTQYYYSSVWVTTADVDYAGIVIEDHASYKTEFTDGVLVGSDTGRSGSVFIGDPELNVSLDLHAGNHADSHTLLYGTTFKDITGTINLGNDTGHKVYSTSFIGCAQVDPVGAPVIRNCIFAETSDVNAALLWNENIDISNSSFIANTTGAGIEMPSAAGTPYAYDNLTFSGNTYDVLNSSGSAISINKNNGSDPTTYEGSTVTFLGISVDTEITVKDLLTGSLIDNARVLVWVTDNTNYFYEASVSITGSGTTATVTHNSHGLETGDYVIISGVTNDDDYNGVFQITYVNENSYTYTTTETLGSSPATGTPVATMAVISGTTSSGVITDNRSWSANQTIAGWVRAASGSPYYQQGAISGTIDKDFGVSLIIQLVKDE